MNIKNPNRKTERTVPLEETRGSFNGMIALDGLTGYINAGGRGTRLSSIFSPHAQTGISKALLPIGRPPISLIEHQINKLNHAGMHTIIAGVGDHLNVAQHIESTYTNRKNVHSIYYEDQLGNGGDLVRAIRERPELFDDNILITNVDTLLDVDEADFYALHREREAGLSIALTLNKGVPNEGAYYIGSHDEVVYCGEANRNAIPENVASKVSVYRGSSTGALIASKTMLRDVDWEPQNGPLSLYGGIVALSLERGGMYAFNNGERLFTDVGTVESWNAAQARYDMIAPYIHYAE